MSFSDLPDELLVRIFRLLLKFSDDGELVLSPNWLKEVTSEDISNLSMTCKRFCQIIYNQLITIEDSPAVPHLDPGRKLRLFAREDTSQFSYPTGACEICYNLRERLGFKFTRYTELTMLDARSCCMKYVIRPKELGFNLDSIVSLVLRESQISPQRLDTILLNLPNVRLLALVNYHTNVTATHEPCNEPRVQRKLKMLTLKGPFHYPVLLHILYNLPARELVLKDDGFDMTWLKRFLLKHGSKIESCTIDCSAHGYYKREVANRIRAMVEECGYTPDEERKVFTRAIQKTE